MSSVNSSKGASGARRTREQSGRLRDRHDASLCPRLTPFAAALTAGLFALDAGSALAATINVNGGCSLVDAINNANADNNGGGNGCAAGSGPDTIVIARPAGSALVLSQANNGSVERNGLPVISSVITIEGDGTGIRREAGAAPFRIFEVASTGNLTLNFVGVSGGSAAQGGAILNRGGILTLNRSTVATNSAERGGGLALAGGTTTLNDSTVSENSATYGGGIYGGVGSRGCGFLTPPACGALTLTNSGVSGNQAEDGGGIALIGATAALSNSRLLGNLAMRGGAIYVNSYAGSGGGPNERYAGALTVSRSTVSGNSATTEGGGVSLRGNGSTSLIDSVISANRAPSGGGIFSENARRWSLIGSTVTGNDSRGLLVLSGESPTLVRSLISGNLSPVLQDEFVGTAPDLATSGNNLFGFSGNPGTYHTPGPTDIVPAVGLPAILNITLADNGGPTRTHALVAGSPAIDAGGACAGTDQRGVNRPKGAACDIGSFEAGGNQANLAIDKTASAPAVVVGDNLSFTLSIANSGPEDASDVQVFDTLPSGLNLVSATPTQGLCVESPARTVSCELGNLANGAAAGVSVLTRTTASGPITNTASVIGSVIDADPDTANNSDAVTVTAAAVDTAPNTFIFIDETNAPRGSLRKSNTVTITGINRPAPISVTGGEFSIGCTALFTSEATTITSGQTVCVQHTSAARAGTAVNTALTVGGVTDRFSSVTGAPDTVPNTFVFVDRTGAALNTAQVSKSIAIRGLEAPAPISVVGGFYSINDGAFTGAAGRVRNGDRVRARHTSASNFNSATNTRVEIGGVADVFTSTTLAGDFKPDPFRFTDRTGVGRSKEQISNSITVTGINAPATISVSGGAYSINDGPFTAKDGKVRMGDRVRARHTSAGGFKTAVNTQVLIGGVTDTFTTTTIRAPDTTPAAFDFVNRKGVNTGVNVLSNTVTIAGLSKGVTASLKLTNGSGGDARFSINGNAFAKGSATVRNGDQVRLRNRISTGASANANIRIGGVSDTWTIRTAP